MKSVKSLPFLSADLIYGMIHELPTDLASHAAVPVLEKFWKVAKARLPFWSEAAFLVALLQPRAAAWSVSSACFAIYSPIAKSVHWRTTCKVV